ncbi:MAG: hypothetical protein M3R65_07545 [Gemmatimonadota bacterium]|nr:hypothetical protein [Gemmatimonadota bacterium]
MKQPHDAGKGVLRLAEPVQVYLQRPERERLERLTDRLGTTKSDVLRRGLAALEAQTKGTAAGAGERIALPTFGGLGLQPGVDLDDTAATLDLMSAGNDATG